MTNGETEVLSGELVTRKLTAMTMDIVNYQTENWEHQTVQRESREHVL
jgi:hypothetical protein